MSPKTQLLALVVAGLALVGPAPTAVTADTPAGTVPPPVEPVETTAAQTAAGPPPVEVLRAWDAQRAEAWGRGDPMLLATLYTPRSVAGRHDVAMLRAWAARGLVVRDMRTQLLAVHQLRHTRTTWTLLITDRMAGGVAVGPGVDRRLPRDEATTRTVRLRLLDGRWRVSAVQPLHAGP